MGMPNKMAALTGLGWLLGRQPALGATQGWLRACVWRAEDNRGAG